MAQPNPVRVTLTTENVGSVADKLRLLMAAFMKMMKGAELDHIEEVNFDDDPRLVVVVNDPVISNLPHGIVRAEVHPLT